MLYQISITSNKVLLIPCLCIALAYFAVLQYAFIHLTFAVKIWLFVLCSVLALLCYRQLIKALPKSFYINDLGQVIYQQNCYTAKVYVNNVVGWFCIKLDGKSLWVLHTSMLTPKDKSRMARLLR